MRISFTGDIMCELPTLRKAKHADGYRFDGIFDGADAAFRKTDYLVGNLETVFAGQDPGYSRDIYSYNTPDSFAAAVREAGFDLVSTANNHCLDRGTEGLRRTLDVLDRVGLKHVGTARTEEEAHPFIAEICGLRIGFLAYTYGSNFAINRRALGENEGYMVNFLTPQTWSFTPRTGWKNALKERLLTRESRVRLMRLLKRTYNAPRVDNDEPGELNPRIFQEIEELKKNCDRVVLLLHAGGQFNDKPGRYTQMVIEELSKTGVDAIIGNHPHVVQPVQRKNGKLVTYSLGNCFVSPDTIYLLHDYLPLYSVVLHMDLAGNGAEPVYSFSILKICSEGKKETVWDAFTLCDRMSDGPEKEKLLADCRFIYRRVTGKPADEFTMQREYPLEFC